MKAESTFEKICAGRVISIIRGLPAACAEAVGSALLEGGVDCVEAAFDQTSAAGAENTLEFIAALSRIPGLLVGAGTVMTAKQVRLAAQAGAKFIISPDVNGRVIACTRGLGLLSVPGALTPSEITCAARLGAGIVKVFPSGVMGVDYFRTLRAPLKHIPMAAMGGINIGNARAFLDAGAVCLGVGGALVSKDDALHPDCAAITARARGLREVIREWALE